MCEESGLLPPSTRDQVSLGQPNFARKAESQGALQPASIGESSHAFGFSHSASLLLCTSRNSKAAKNLCHATSLPVSCCFALWDSCVCERVALQLMQFAWTFLCSIVMLCIHYSGRHLNCLLSYYMWLAGACAQILGSCTEFVVTSF